jgi:hypothetical protein
MRDRCHFTLGGGVALHGSPSCLSLRLVSYADGTWPAGPVRHYRACRGNDAFCKSAPMDFRHASSMRVPVEGWQGRSLWDSLATYLEALTFETGPEHSLIRHFLLARGGVFACKLPSPQRGRGLLSFLPSKGKGLAWCPTTPCRAGHPRQSLPEGLPRASSLDSF